MFPNTQLGNQMPNVAIRNVLNVNRQVFYAAIGKWDTHDNQASDLDNKHPELAGAMTAFRDAMIELSQWNSVAMFSAPDFGRSINNNGDGTDHGWGGHHFVARGAVRGRSIDGDIAPINLASEFYERRSRANLIPSVSIKQYGAELG